MELRRFVIARVQTPIIKMETCLLSTGAGIRVFVSQSLTCWRGRSVEVCYMSSLRMFGRQTLDVLLFGYET